MSVRCGLWNPDEPMANRLVLVSLYLRTPFIRAAAARHVLPNGPVPRCGDEVSLGIQPRCPRNALTRARNGIAPIASDRHPGADEESRDIQETQFASTPRSSSVRPP